MTSDTSIYAAMVAELGDPVIDPPADLSYETLRALAITAPVSLARPREFRPQARPMPAAGGLLVSLIKAVSKTPPETTGQLAYTGASHRWEQRRVSRQSVA